MILRLILAVILGFMSAQSGRDTEDHLLGCPDPLIMAEALKRIEQSDWRKSSLSEVQTQWPWHLKGLGCDSKTCSFEELKESPMALIRLLALVLSMGTAVPQFTAAEVKSLTGVTTVCIDFDRLGEPGFEEYLGLNQTRKDAENKLRLAGIEIDRTRIPNLFIGINFRGRRFVEGRPQEYDCVVELQFNQFARLVRNDLEVYVTTWKQTRYVGGSGDRARKDIREAVLNMINVFIKDYFTANPKQ